MNCQQFRQTCLIEPTCQQPDFLHHRQNCSACFTFAEEMQQFERTLIDAIKIEVPVGLTQRILQQQRKKAWFQPILSFWHGNAKRPRYALATSLILVVSLFVWGLWWQAHSSSLSQEVMVYLEKEPRAFITDDKVPSTELRGMFQAIGAQLTSDIGTVHFCQLLTLQEYKSAHIVLTGMHGTINVIFIPDSQFENTQFSSPNQLKGIIYATTWGNLVLVGGSEEPFENIATHLNKSVKWL